MGPVRCVVKRMPEGFAMVHKVLSIVSKILFGLVTLAFMACLVYTLASPTVQASLDEISSSVQGIVDSVSSAASQATDAIDAGWQATAGAASGVAGLAGSAASTASAETAGTDGAASASVTDAANAGSGTKGGTGAGETGAAELADTAQGQAYLSWKAAVADPVARVFGTTGVTEALLEGVAGGSTSASSALTGMDETVLVSLSASASNYATGAAANGVPSTLPEEVRAQMWEANSAAQGFAAAVQSIVEAVRGARGGNLLSLGDLMSAADSAVQSVRALNACFSSAEAALRG